MLYLLYLLVAALSSQAYEVPELDRVLVNVSGASKGMPELPRNFTFLNWNVYKGSRGEVWHKDFLALSEGVHVITLQEAVRDEIMPLTFQRLTDVVFWMAQSFLKETYSTGVVTGSYAEPLDIHFHKSPITEPIINTPKMSLLTTFGLPDGRSLLVINMHAINFVSYTSFKKQLLDVSPSIESFDGPKIFAGDFNTWSLRRWMFLHDHMKAMGFTQVQFKNLREGSFDQVFTKGCEASDAIVRNDITSSDHFPMIAKFKCLK